VRRRLFIAAVLVQVIVLVGWVASLERALASASLVRLEVVPVDPRDLLRGDYVQLRYRVSTVASDLFAPPLGGGHWGETVYVALAPKGDVWEVVAASLARANLALQPGQRVLAGRILSEPSPNVVITYGIERYYVPEGKGTPPRGRMDAEVALTADGRAFLRQLFIDGRPYP